MSGLFWWHTLDYAHITSYFSGSHLAHIAIRASLTACSAEFAIRQNPAIWITSLYHAIRNPY